MRTLKRALVVVVILVVSVAIFALQGKYGDRVIYREHSVLWKTHLTVKSVIEDGTVTGDTVMTIDENSPFPGDNFHTINVRWGKSYADIEVELWGPHSIKIILTADTSDELPGDVVRVCKQLVAFLPEAVKLKKMEASLGRQRPYSAKYTEQLKWLTNVSVGSLRRPTTVNI